jgi:hypothetical protein
MLAQSILLPSKLYLVTLSGSRTATPYFIQMNLSKNEARKEFYFVLQRYTFLQRWEIDSTFLKKRLSATNQQLRQPK